MNQRDLFQAVKQVQSIAQSGLDGRSIGIEQDDALSQIEEHVEYILEAKDDLDDATMKCEIGYLNESYSAEEEFMIYQLSGSMDDVPERIREVMTISQWHESDQGDWVMLVDGVVRVLGPHHPFKIHCMGEQKSEIDLGERKLYTIASARGIEGRSRMRENELVEAIIKDVAQENGVEL